MAGGDALNRVIILVFVKHQIMSISLTRTFNKACLEELKCYYWWMLDKKKIKEKLEQERDSLLLQMKDMGKWNAETGEWEAIPEEIEFPESDENDKADRFEDFEARSSMMRTLEPRLKNILKALKNLSKESFGKCEVCKKDIEQARLEVNPAARTCKKHLENN